MVVGSKGWAERRYIREVKDVQRSSDTSRIVKDIQEAFFPVEYRRTNEAPTVATSEVLRFECLSRCNYSAYSRNVGGSTLRVPVEVLFQCLQSQRRRFYASSACRGAIPVPTVATAEGLRFECLSRCYSSDYSRNVGGSTLRVPVEVLFQCLQSQRRRFYASSACRGAIPVPTVATSEVLRFECLSRCYSSAYSRNVGGTTLRVPVEVLSQCLQSPRRRFYASSACRGAIPVPTVATSEVLRFECLSRCYPSAYSRNVGGSTLRVPVEVQLQCLQSPRRRFHASSACRGAIPVPTVTTSEVLRFECLSRCNPSAYSRHVGGSTLRVPVEVLVHGAYSRRFYASSACRGAIPVPTVATSEVLRFECLSRCYPSAYSRHVGGSTLRVPVEVQLQCLQSQRRRFYASSACRGAIQRRLSSQRRRFYAPSLKCHIRRDFKDTGHIAPPSVTPSSEPELRPNISTTPRKDCELIPSCWEGLGGF